MASCRVSPTAGSLIGDVPWSAIAVTRDSLRTVNATFVSSPLKSTRTSADPGSKPLTKPWSLIATTSVRSVAKVTPSIAARAMCVASALVSTPSTRIWRWSPNPAKVVPPLATVASMWSMPDGAMFATGKTSDCEREFPKMSVAVTIRYRIAPVGTAVFSFIPKTLL